MSLHEAYLRKAENKLLTNAGEFLRLLTVGTTTDPLGVSNGSEEAAD